MSDPRRGADAENGHHKRPTWLTFGLPASIFAILISVVVYIFTIGHEIGAIRTQLDLTVLRVDKLELSGSGPVQQSTERLAQVQSRLDRVVSELLDTQKRMGELAAQQARQDEQQKH